ncbi:hypothetical protein TSUD_144930 [Trifolium subterraneum]|uniref:Uncharacterized protein n=1 Tax=Trifolium subterraneum TaxID=3900 RepID=A0A2Z6N7C4_TRISU|nr:hypothetical protein TSUD_144930 [Trifolium subterraneum]
MVGPSPVSFSGLVVVWSPRVKDQDSVAVTVFDVCGLQAPPASSSVLIVAVL